MNKTLVIYDVEIIQQSISIIVITLDVVITVHTHMKYRYVEQKKKLFSALKFMVRQLVYYERQKIIFKVVYIVIIVVL